MSCSAAVLLKRISPNWYKAGDVFEDETGKTASIIVETFEKLNNQLVRARQVYGKRA